MFGILAINPDIKWPLAETSRCGEFLDALLGLLRARPEYVTEQDARRYMALIYNFRCYSLPAHPSGRRDGPIENLPLGDFQRALRSWVSSWFGEGEHPLMHTYAIDAARFIWWHAHGFESILHGGSHEPDWKIPPMFPASLLEHGGFVFDAKAKRIVTERLNGLLALAAVPPRARCMSTFNGSVLLDAGAEFVVQVERCHLSSGIHDVEHLRAIEDDAKPIDIAEDFRFFSTIVALHDQRSLNPALSRYRNVRMAAVEASKPPVKYNMNLPIRWITHVVLPRDDGTDPEYMPVPEWLTRQGFEPQL